jgi:hypothetical protein
MGNANQQYQQRTAVPATPTITIKIATNTVLNTIIVAPIANNIKQRQRLLNHYGSTVTMGTITARTITPIETTLRSTLLPEITKSI